MRAVVGRTGNVLSALYLALLIAFALRFMWASLFRVWFFSSDEYVFAAEVIRFVNLDFRQHFFDMPGTPFMFLASAAWSVFYGVQCVLGSFPAQRGIGEFTFEHLPALFILMRGATLLFFCLSLILLFWLATGLMNKPAAWVATLILAMSTVYTSYSSFVRVESLSMCFMVAALLCLLQALDHRQPLGAGRPRVLWGFFDLVFLAGFLAGLGAAARLHSVTASVPVLVFLMLLSPRPGRSADYPRWVKIVAALAAVILAAVGWLLVFRLRSYFELLPHAYHLIQTGLLGAACALVLGFVLYRTPPTRGLLVRIVSPDLIRMLLAFGTGLLLGTPTILRQYPFFLQSIEMYSVNYTDMTRVALPFWTNFQWYVNYYLSVLAPDGIVFALLILGAVGLLVRRDRRVLPFLVGAIVFFVSKPLNLRAEPHHVILWLPFYAIVCSYPVALLVEVLSRHLRHGLAWASVVFLIVFTSLCLLITPGPKRVARDTPYVEERLGNVSRATDWIKQYTEPQTNIAVSYFCFNPDVFYTWMRSLDVPVPPSMFDGRNYMIWWGHARALKGKTGYACLTRVDVDSIKTRLDAISPGEGTDPFTDRRFRSVQSFGTGDNAVSVFRFDYR